MFLLSFLLFGSLDTKVTFQAVPDTTDDYLQSPGDVAVDDQGRVHVLDLQSKTIFVWNPDGTFLQQYGTQGQGPGEFSFGAGAGGNQGYINCVGGSMYIYDGGHKSVIVYDEDLNYVKTESYLIDAGRIEQFRQLKDGKALIFFSSYFSEVPFRKIALYGPDKKPIHTFVEAEDNTWHYTGTGNNRNVVLHAYDVGLHLGYNELTGEVAIGDSSKSNFATYTIQGKETGKVEMELVRYEVQQEDKDEWESMGWWKNQTFFKVQYPELKAYYDQILPLGKDRYFAFIVSPNIRRVQGAVVNKNGKTLKRVDMTCGNGGGLFGSRGQIFCVSTSDDGDFEIKEVQ